MVTFVYKAIRFTTFISFVEKIKFQTQICLLELKCTIFVVKNRFLIAAGADILEK
jgi:hypothetical protein